MEEHLSEWLATVGSQIGTGEDIEIDEQMRSRLTDLGYLDHEM
jgi:Fe2+ transport system protein FeoA